MKWKHFQRHWPFVRGNRRSPLDSLKRATNITIMVQYPSRYLEIPRLTSYFFKLFNLSYKFIEIYRFISSFLLITECDCRHVLEWFFSICFTNLVQITFATSHDISYWDSQWVQWVPLADVVFVRGQVVVVDLNHTTWYNFLCCFSQKFVNIS